MDGSMYACVCLHVWAPPTLPASLSLSESLGQKLEIKPQQKSISKWLKKCISRLAYRRNKKLVRPQNEETDNARILLKIQTAKV